MVLWWCNDGVVVVVVIVFNGCSIVFWCRMV